MDGDQGLRKGTIPAWHQGRLPGNALCEAPSTAEIQFALWTAPPDCHASVYANQPLGI